MEKITDLPGDIIEVDLTASAWLPPATNHQTTATRQTTNDKAAADEASNPTTPTRNPASRRAQRSKLKAVHAAGADREEEQRTHAAGEQRRPRAIELFHLPTTCGHKDDEMESQNHVPPSSHHIVSTLGSFSRTQPFDTAMGKLHPLAVDILVRPTSDGKSRHSSTQPGGGDPTYGSVAKLVKKVGRRTKGKDKGEAKPQSIASISRIDKYPPLLLTTADGVLQYRSTANTAIMFNFLSYSNGRTSFLIDLGATKAMQKHIVRQQQVLLQSIKWL
ncbi:hypothetical protein INS49_010623 [Diaporthe citri]|uniref:uncharacterized protein n=1 Tax=Diaporthe citri TaxID=83186 RepID=UPI001C7E4041|nr:uncharacterized protein INS49_010623 [Diaporthe citri]KAG6362393.1 hypothetical protein INS49_010623 [Diaporthe citri]